MESSHLDSLAVQRLFGVREQRARQLVAGLPGLRAGNASAVLRQALIVRLEEMAQGGLFQWETNRRARVVEELDRTRRQLAARRVRIPAGGRRGGPPAAGSLRRYRNAGAPLRAMINAVISKSVFL